MLPYAPRRSDGLATSGALETKNKKETTRNLIASDPDRRGDVTKRPT